MNYFTIDWYKEMQVYGFLTFPDTREDWEENIAYYKSEGIDYKANFQSEIEERKEDLLRFLPAAFHVGRGLSPANGKAVAGIQREVSGDEAFAPDNCRSDT